MPETPTTTGIVVRCQLASSNISTEVTLHASPYALRQLILNYYIHTYTTYMCTIVHTYVELTSYDANSIACTRCAGVKYFLKLNALFFSSSFSLDTYETFIKQFHEIT